MIKEAIRWSSTIPIHFQGARRYKGLRYKRKLLDILADGGTADNYPIHILRKNGASDRYMIGFKLYNDDEQRDGEPIVIKDHGNVKWIKPYLFRIVEILREQALKYHVHKEDWKLTCKINVGQFQTTDFDITDKDKQWLFESGRKAMDEHLMEIEKLLDEGKYPL